MPDGSSREVFFAFSRSVTGGSAFLPVERLVANKAGGASLCQRRQPPKAGAEGQRLQRLVPPATIGPRVGWADHAGLRQRLPTMPSGALKLRAGTNRH